MTDVQQVQYDRFLVAGYDPEDARTLIERGAWLGTTSMSEQEVADVRRYRAEHDREAAAPPDSCAERTASGSDGA